MVGRRIVRLIRMVRTMNKGTLDYANQLLIIMKEVREKVMTRPIPKDVKDKSPEILIETFYMSMKDLIEKSIKEGEPKYV